MVETMACDVFVVMAIFLSEFQAPGLELLSRTRPVHPIRVLKPTSRAIRPYNRLGSFPCSCENHD